MAAGFLTRIPLPGRYDEKKMPLAIVCFPIVGIILGAVLGAGAYVADFLLPDLAAGAIVMICYIFLTGGLHLDGLMDTADGLGSWRDREKMLLIMKDSRVGAMGAIAGSSHLILRFALFASLLALPEKAQVWSVFLVFPLFARLDMVFAMVHFPYARTEGLGKPFVAASKLWVGIATAGITVVYAVCIAYLFEAYLVVAVVGFVSLIQGASLAYYIAGKLGGLTGDTYGAIGEVSEDVSVAVALIILHLF